MHRYYLGMGGFGAQGALEHKTTCGASTLQECVKHVSHRRYLD
eukprot:SAG11_NODE_32919_length_280_cov_0.574586_1_plen_42_part_01